MKKKWIAAIIIIAIVGGSISAWWFITMKQNARQENKGEEVVTIKKGALRVIVEATGRVVPNQEVEIKCKASGEIKKLPVDVSDAVKKDDILLQVDPEEEKRYVRKSEVSLSISQARHQQSILGLKTAEQEFITERTRAMSGLKSAEAKYKESKAKFERVTELLKKRMTSVEELDIAQNAYTQSLVDLETARTRIEALKTIEIQIDQKHQDIKIAEAQVETDKISLSDAEQRLKDTTVLSPIDGIVSEKNVQIGQIIASGINNVGGGTTVMKLADLSIIYILVSVDESDIGKIAIGQEVKITVDAYSNIIFSGVVERIATKGLLNSNVITFEVKVHVKGANHQLLKPEMTANVEIVTLDKDNVLLVPLTALDRKRHESFITVRKPGNVNEQRKVTIGTSDGAMVEILSGISEGEQVVLSEKDSQSRWRSDKEKEKNASRQPRMNMRMMGGPKR
ncbi:MAG: efflux RND transporter periplasmic adaptor subunit [Desulfobacterales bacterium]|nr:efflux RND transporter periplasmic adaptor subunit [Desulfobacterales bacterium]